MMLGPVIESQRGETLRLSSDQSAFAAIRSGDALPPSLLVFRHFRLERSGESGTARVLASLSGGDPIIVEKEHGRGDVILVGTALGESWSTLPKTAVFLPLLHEMVTHLATPHAGAADYRVGEPLRMEMPGEVYGHSVRIRPPGATEAVDMTVLPLGARFIAQYDDTRRNGVYQIDMPSSGGEEQTIYCTVNVDPAEGDLSRISTKEVAALLEVEQLEVEADHPAEARTAESVRRFEAGWIALLLVCALLAAELAATQIR
jgi:hypothetical protein